MNNKKDNFELIICTIGKVLKLICIIVFGGIYLVFKFIYELSDKY